MEELVRQEFYQLKRKTGKQTRKLDKNHLMQNYR